MSIIVICYTLYTCTYSHINKSIATHYIHVHGVHIHVCIYTCICHHSIGYIYMYMSSFYRVYIHVYVTFL